MYVPSTHSSVSSKFPGSLIRKTIELPAYKKNTDFICYCWIDGLLES